MPRSKRNKQVELAKTKKRGLEWKKHLLEEVRSCVDTYANVFVFSVNDMRNSKMKNVREQWKHSRFFIGKNKIMAMAFGRTVEEEYKPNLHKIGQAIRGQRGLLFSNKPTEEVVSWFRSYSEGDFARSGNVSTEDVTLSEGPLPMFPHNLEPYLRQLGLPTSLVKGQIHLIKEHEVCKSGDVLTPESAKILKLLGYEMAEFHITIDCMWSHDGSFVEFTNTIDSDSKENIKKEKKKKKKSLEKKSPSKIESQEENMEVELAVPPDDLSSESDEDNNLVEETSEVKTPLTTLSNTPAAITSTPKAIVESSEVINDVQANKIEVDAADEDEEIPELVEAEKSSPKNSRPLLKSTRKSRSAAKRDSLPKTPDANTSQDSPVIRQLRNRSVKVSRKKK